MRPPRFKIFIANRVSEILKTSNASQWRYVNTASNPVDLASRGMSVQSFLKTDAWLCGPDFLREPEYRWPKNPETLESALFGDPEVKAVVVNAAQVEQVSPVQKLIFYFSSWFRLKRAVGWLLRFKTLLLSLVQHQKLVREDLSKTDLSIDQLEKKIQVQMEGIKSQVPKEVLSVEDMVMAELNIVRFCQRVKFLEELSHLKKGECVRRTSHLYKLNPILDGDLIRVGGRSVEQQCHLKQNIQLYWLKINTFLILSLLMYIKKQAMVDKTTCFLTCVRSIGFLGPVLPSEGF